MAPSTATSKEEVPVPPVLAVPVALRAPPMPARVPARMEEMYSRVTHPLIGSDVLLSGEEVSMAGPDVQLTEDEIQELLR